mmetsp:Transcript_4552/g.11685  ORF Transcript_4552/g.11685 Transcript_4552/m.11685 type:complete len:231 (-) Transcript_4552:126-818(-)
MPRSSRLQRAARRACWWGRGDWARPALAESLMRTLTNLTTATRSPSSPLSSRRRAHRNCARPRKAALPSRKRTRTTAWTRRWMRCSTPRPEVRLSWTTLTCSTTRRSSASRVRPGRSVASGAAKSRGGKKQSGISPWRSDGNSSTCPTSPRSASRPCPTRRCSTRACGHPAKAGGSVARGCSSTACPPSARRAGRSTTQYPNALQRSPLDPSVFLTPGSGGDLSGPRGDS